MDKKTLKTLGIVATGIVWTLGVGLFSGGVCSYIYEQEIAQREQEFSSQEQQIRDNEFCRIVKERGGSMRGEQELNRYLNLNRCRVTWNEIRDW